MQHCKIWICYYYLIICQYEAYVPKHGTMSDIHEYVHRDTIMKVTNKMQLYRLIYYS